MATIKADRHTFNWPKNNNVPDTDLIRIVNAKVYDTNNEPIPDAIIQVDRQHFNYLNPQEHNRILLTANLNNQTASLPISIDVVDPKMADYQPNKNTSVNQINQSYPQPQSNKDSKNKKHRNWWIPALIILAILALLFGLNSCHQQKVNQEQNQQIGQLKDQNRDLKNQIQELNNAVKQYKNDNNNNQLQEELNQIKSELQNNNSSNADTVRKVINQIQNDPNNAEDYLSTLYNSQNVIQNIQSQITNWLAEHGISVNNN